MEDELKARGSSALCHHILPYDYRMFDLSRQEGQLRIFVDCCVTAQHDRVAFTVRRTCTALCPRALGGVLWVPRLPRLASPRGPRGKLYSAAPDDFHLFLLTRLPASGGKNAEIS